MTMQRSQNDLSPLTLSVAGFTDSIPMEDDRIRIALDSVLEQLPGKYDTATSALMIFPYKQWKRRKATMSSMEFFDWYLTKFFPRLRARNPLNRRGTYFERMIGFRGTNGPRKKLKLATKNQLGQIIHDWKKARRKGRRPRRSALQASCFDPPKDHNGSALSPFPCLQQVSFSYDNAGGLAVNAYYPTQYVFDRAYGNYLGLSHLGHFMAHELDLQFVRLNCFIGHPELGRNVTKRRLRELEETVQRIVADAQALHVQ